MPASAAPPQATRFGRYRLLEQLGAGGMAVVHRAIVDGPEGFQRTVVVKRILPELSKNPKFVKMFLAEARLCALLHHPTIVQVNDLGEVDGDYFLAMEFVDGVDLSSLLRHAFDLRRPMPPGVACYIAAEIASALAYAHALTDDAGRPLAIVHRDVSPSNIRVTPLGGLKLLDFGIARAAGHLRDERTLTGTLKGKISYMSPEQADGQPVDRRTDVFALGIVLYECLTLERLFRGEDDFETLRLVREAKVWPPSSVRPDLDADVDAVVARMLARTPEARYQSCDEVAQALEPIVRRLDGDAAALRRYLQELGPIAARAEPPSQATTPAKASATPRTVTRSSGELRPSGAPGERGWLWPVLAALVMAGGLGGVFALSRTPPAEKAPPEKSSAPPEKFASKEPPAPPRAAEKVDPPAAKTIQLSIAGPTGAEVFLDGKSIGKLPLDTPLEPAPHARTLLVKRAGYDPWTATFDGARDQHLDAKLHKRAAKSTEVIKDPFGK
ncbi:MAG TPA: protein kinase [Polyangia bacterium]|nr:protein kinase [Polyangia bacterium]